MDALTDTTCGDARVFDKLLIAERLVGVTWGTAAPGRSAGVWGRELVSKAVNISPGLGRAQALRSN